MKKKLLSIIFLTTLSAGIGFYYLAQYKTFIEESVFKSNQIIKIEKGQNFSNFTKDIEKLQANGKEWQWRLFAKIEEVGTWLRVGEFEISKDMTPIQMMNYINSNKVINYKFTIVEGMNWHELKQKLYDDPILLKSLSGITDAQLLLLLKTDKKTPEGLFLPETYQFEKGDTDFDVLKRAHIDLKRGLEKHWNSKKSNLPLNNSYELLTLASIVEKETAIASERDVIAGVFTRRLQLNMRLQTDPTVIYGLGQNYDGDIKTKDLTTDTPYNTYTRKGLTPTPIAMASIEAIAASAQPKEGKSLYFVANNRGGHYFSDTYIQHQKAVKAYLKGKKL